MNTLLSTLISWLQQYGYPALWLSIFIAAIGVPLPTNLVLLAAGAFATLRDFNLAFLAAIALSASVCGDSLGYLLGRRIGSKFLDWLEQQQRFHLISPLTIARSRVYFQRRGAWAIFLSRFLFSALGGVINFIAGAEVYPYHRFLIYDACGEAIGALLPLGLGYVFGTSWEAIGDIFGTTSLFLLALLIAIYLIASLIKMIRRASATKAKRMYHLIEKKCLSVDLVQEGQKILPP